MIFDSDISFKSLCLLDRVSEFRAVMPELIKLNKYFRFNIGALKYLLILSENQQYFKNEENIQMILIQYIKEQLNKNNDFLSAIDEVFIEARGIIKLSEFEKENIRNAWRNIINQYEIAKFMRH